MILRALVLVCFFVGMGSGCNCITLQLVQQQRIERLPDFDCILKLAKMDPAITEANSSGLKDRGQIQLVLQEGDHLAIAHIIKGQDKNTFQPFLQLSYQKDRNQIEDDKLVTKVWNRLRPLLQKKCGWPIN